MDNSNNELLIKDWHCVYVRIPLSFLSRDKLPSASAFQNTPKEGDNLSCDWCQYCSPASSRSLIGKQKKKDGQFKDPNSFFIWRFNVGGLRNKLTPLQKVIYDPIYNNPEDEFVPNNKAHSIIIGDKPKNNAEFRVGLLKIGEWAIPPP